MLSTAVHPPSKPKPLTVSVKTSKLMLLNLRRSSQQNLLVVDILEQSTKSREQTSGSSRGAPWVFWGGMCRFGPAIFCFARVRRLQLH